VQDPTTPSNVITVVAAIIERDGRLLLTRRLTGTHLAGLWEFPGGKCDAAESHEICLRREIREELGAGIVPGPLVLATTHAYPERTVTLYFYEAELTEEPRPILGQEMRWVARDELRALDFPEADAALIELLVSRAAIKGHENTKTEDTN
jgi:8-oxo-dGTP diphosphatase